MYRAVILTGPGFQEHEVIYSYYRLRGEGYEVDIATKEGQSVRGTYGVPLPLDTTARPLISFEDLAVLHYDAVICTGGYEAPDCVRQDPKALAFVKEMDEANRVVAGLGHGPWIMISAGIMGGRTACAYVGMKDDLINAGATVVDAEVIVSHNVITGSYYAWVETFLKAVLEAVEQQPTAQLVRL